MNQFVVSARKYRPSTFDTVVGQSHITNTLKNAIRSNHLAQAFLFCGPRGVGKTTCARILAKTLNCSKISENIEACNECESCKSFNSGQSLNIYELDAASNNSVEDMRGLVEQVRYAPHSGEYKIYIIDEVHMLSTSAFNAFLKTLEEPPSYAIFILATTEKHKIIPTILSRCQIFDFNRIQVEDIASHLNYVANAEHVSADPDALHIIAQKADGALRDALSIFDQIVSFAGNTITYKDVINNLSILDYDYYFKVTEEITSGNIPSILLTFNELLNEGFDGHHFINGLASHFRDLLVCQDVVTLPLLEVSKNIRERYKEQATKTSPALLLQLLEICSKCDLEYRAAKNQRLHVELALIRMCSLSENGIQITTKAFSAGIEKKSPDQNINSNASPSVKVNKTEEAKAVFTEHSDDKIDRPSGIQPNPKITESVTKEISTKTPVSPSNEPVRTSPVSRLGGSLLKGTSISAGVQKTIQKEESPSTAQIDNLPVDLVDNERLLQVWDEYATLQQKDGKRQLFTTLTMDKPSMIDEFTIELVIHNQSQDNLLQEEKQELLDFLRKKLNNFKLKLKTRIEERAGSDEVAYTNKERYQKMVQKNPDLEEFRKQLGLELE